MEGFPSGQREQTENLSSMTSVVQIHHLPPKQKDIPKGMSFFCFGGRWLWIRKPALRNVPAARFNRRGLAAARRIHHRTGKQACGSAPVGGSSQSRQAEAVFEGMQSRHIPNPKGRTGCPTIKSTCIRHRRGAPMCAPGQPSARIPIGGLLGKGSAPTEHIAKDNIGAIKLANHLQTRNRRGGQWPPTAHLTIMWAADDRPYG